MVDRGRGGDLLLIPESLSLRNMNHFDLQVRQVSGHSLAFLRFDLKGEKVNKFNREVMTEFEGLIPLLKSKAAEIEALILVSGKLGNFIAGADITLFQAAKTAPEAQALSEAGQKLLNEWEDLPFLAWWPSMVPAWAEAVNCPWPARPL